MLGLGCHKVIMLQRSVENCELRCFNTGGGPLSYRHQFCRFAEQSMDRFLYDRDVHHERIKVTGAADLGCMKDVL